VTFGHGLDDLFPDDACAWFGVMQAWLAEGMAQGHFQALKVWDDRVRWGTETKPDAATWGADAGTQAAIRMMEAGQLTPPEGDSAG